MHAGQSTCTPAIAFVHVGVKLNIHVVRSLPQDPIHPEYVLQAPYEVFTFQYNPANPEIVAAGCYNGQVGLGPYGLLGWCLIAAVSLNGTECRGSVLVAVVTWEP